ncbi:hypothetical protein [Flavobacterium sediminis]|uniref:hypothetical protein n=1 Tax=Flavobacterium sediminis TaxID=2201181 RepID=UPI0015CFEDB0|nr:hypothetical protein [Flavobacterium sediminis]
MRRSIILISLLGLISCKQEDVQLPKSDLSVQKEIYDHSPVYLFFRVEGKDTIAKINRKNTIGTTNWIFNIDKRLPLHAVIPEVQQLQEKKKNGMHKREDAVNVYSYADSIGKNLAFLPFTDVQYFYDKDFSKFYIKEHAELYQAYNNLTINFNKENEITIDGNGIDREEFVPFVRDFADFMSDGKNTIIHLNFSKYLTYEQYIQNKILAWQLTSDRIQLSSYEFVYDEKKLPECGCKL